MGGWVVMNGAFGVAEPLLFVGERSTWYGRLFAGRAREAVFDLFDTSSRPLVSMTKEFGVMSTSARVSFVCQAEPPGPAVQARGDYLKLGTIVSEWDAVKRRLVVVDATPNHAAGTIALESPSVLDDTFHIKLGDAVLGTVTRPRNGMGIAMIQLNAGALDPFRANRMRALLICGTLLVCDLYWQLVPGPATLLKAATVR
jgi:hypothetical protein